MPDKIRRYLPTIGLSLPPELQGDLLAVIELRNKIVHQVQSDAMESAVARKALDTLMIVVRLFMRQLAEPRPTTARKNAPPHRL
jgi:hypothetical protein